MKKTGLLLLILATAAAAQTAGTGSSQVTATSTTMPAEQVQSPTYADLYCAGFVTPQAVPNANFVAGGLNTPNTTKFVNGDLIYLAGSGYAAGQQYSLVRELRNPNKHELFHGQDKVLKATGQPYAELGRARVVDVRGKTAVAQVEFSCEPINPGDTAVPYVEKQPIAFHRPMHFDRFAPPSAKAAGRIVMARDFDSELGTGQKVYLNVGANSGVKAGDYFRAVRSYTADLQDEADSLSFKASATEDTQKHPASTEPNFLTRTSGPAIHVADLPRRSVGEIVVLSTTPTSSTGMIVFALEDVHVGDQVELDEQQ